MKTQKLFRVTFFVMATIILTNCKTTTEKAEVIAATIDTLTTPKDIVKSQKGEVKIGTQTWTTKNLNVNTYRNGDVIPQVQDITKWNKLTTGAWRYNYIRRRDGAWIDTCGKYYGKCYNFYAVNDARGLAPIGYHIPSDNDWKILITYLGGEALAGSKLKSNISYSGQECNSLGRIGWIEDNSDNSSGFSALPGGNSDDYTGYMGFWWTSSKDEYDSACAYVIGSGGDHCLRRPQPYSSGLSVRCLKD